MRLCQGTIPILLILVVVLGGTATAFARVSLEKKLVVREEYYSNLFLASDNEEDDYVTLAIPGLHLQFDSKSLEADIYYQLEFRLYKDNTEENETSLKDTQRLKADATLFPTGDFTVELLDEYMRVIIDERRPTSETNPFINKSNLNRFEVNPSYRLRRFSTFEPSVGYRYRNLNYTSSEGNDSDSHRFDAGLVKRVTPHFRLKGLYGYEIFQSDQANRAEDFDRQDVLVGIEIEPLPNMKLGAEAGRAWIDFSDSRQSDGWLWRAWLDYGLTARLESKLEYSQDFVSSVDLGLIKNQTALASLGYVGKRRSANVSVFYNKADYQEVDREDESVGMRMNVKHPLTRHFSVGANGYVIYYRFSGDGSGTEDVGRWGVAADLDYQLRILTLALGASHERSDSEIDANDYRSNVVFAEARLAF